MSTTKNPYPVLGEIAAEIELLPDGTCRMPDERVAHWVRHLTERYPRARHLDLYKLLGGLCLEFARRKTFASIQLFILASVGASEQEQAALAGRSQFLQSDQARKQTQKIIADTKGAGPGLTPPGGAGVGLRGRRR